MMKAAGTPDSEVRTHLNNAGVGPLTARAERALLREGEPLRHLVVVEQAAKARQFLVPRLALWQKRLQLDDWSITLLQVKSSDLKPNTLGNIHWNSDKAPIPGSFEGARPA